MHNSKQISALAVVVGAALLATSIVNARDNQGSPRSMMSRMSCGGMMQGGTRDARPNDQWRKEAPTKQNKDS
jgi:hypothetical protein